MRYNFETQKGIIVDVKTTQGDGFVHSDLTKKISKDEFILEKGNIPPAMPNILIFTSE